MKNWGFEVICNLRVKQQDLSWLMQWGCSNQKMGAEQQAEQQTSGFNSHTMGVMITYENHL